MVLFYMSLVMALLGLMKTTTAVAGTTEIELYSNANCDTSSTYRSIHVMATTDAGCFQVAQHIMSFKPLFKDTAWGSFGFEYCTDGCGKGWCETFYPGSQTYQTCHNAANLDPYYYYSIVNSGQGERSIQLDPPVKDTVVTSGRLEKRGRNYLIGLAPDNFNGWTYTVKSYKYTVIACTFLETSGTALTKAIFSKARDTLANGGYGEGVGQWTLDLPDVFIRWTNPDSGVYNFEPDLAYGIAQDLGRGVAYWTKGVGTVALTVQELSTGALQYWYYTT